MALIKQISVYGGTNWDTRDIGANAGNIDLIAPNSTVTTNLVGSSNLFTALNNILPTNQLSPSKVVITDANKKLYSSDTTSTQLGYVHNVTGPIQSQIDDLENNLFDFGKNCFTVARQYHHNGIPSGTSQTQNLTIQFTKSDLLSDLVRIFGPTLQNAQLFGSSCCIDTSQLPYINGNGKYTIVSTLNTNSFTIQNTAGEWPSGEIYMVYFFKLPTTSS